MVWLQGLFKNLTALFEIVGLWIKVGKMVGMICRPFWVSRTKIETAYKQRTTGEGLTYRVRQRVREQCLYCVEEMVAGSLAVHQQTQHGVDLGGKRQWEILTTDGYPQMYQVSFSTAAGPW